MTERGLKNINVFYSTFTNVLFNFVTFFYVFLFFLEHFLHLWRTRPRPKPKEQDQDQNYKTKTTGSKQVLGGFNFQVSERHC